MMWTAISHSYQTLLCIHLTAALFSSNLNQYIWIGEKNSVSPSKVASKLLGKCLL